MFSFLDAREVTKLEGTSKRMNNFASDWVVWKNIIED